MNLITPRTRVRVDGIAKSGEVSPKGTVTHFDHWDDTVAVMTEPAAIHYAYNDNNEIRPLTMDEMIERGYFIVGKGPA